MSQRSRSASTAGEVVVEEFGYGLGPANGILVLRYPPTDIVVDFPESRDDFVHQLFWSPDGVIAARRGRTARFLGADEALWVRRGVLFEARALRRQTVLRVCLREANPELVALSSGAVRLPAAARGLLQRLARPGVSDETGLAARRRLLRMLAESARASLEHDACGAGPAREVARTLLADPADATGLDAWAARLHVSTKTLQRDFLREHGVAFSVWRTRARLQAARAFLDLHTVTETAHLVGYASVSAFVTAFTREFGTTPGQHAQRAG